MRTVVGFVLLTSCAVAPLAAQEVVGGTSNFTRPRESPVQLPHTVKNSVELSVPKAKPETPNVGASNQNGAAAPRIYPINLAVALQLANVRPLDVAIAARQVQLASARYDRARYRWLPTVHLGSEYFHHDGAFQNFEGKILKESRSSAMAGLGANAIWGVSEVIFAPLAARQDLKARQAFQQAMTNDVTLAVVEAYFHVLQARGELAGALQNVRDGEELVQRTEKLAEGLAPALEVNRARVELARRRQVAITTEERWRLASAELMRLLRLDPSALVDPMEPSNLKIELIDPRYSVDDLILIGLMTRPELAGNQALVQATVERLRQEKLRPLIPSVVLRSASTNPSGTLAYGAFGGGPGGQLANFGQRFDYDVQILWELQNFGLGNKARINERRAENEIAMLELFRMQDRVAAEIVQAYTQVQATAERLAVAEPAFREARESMEKNLKGLMQTRRLDNMVTLIVRPAEVVSALQALGQANIDYFAAVAEFNRAQFRLFRALGHPAQGLAGKIPEAALGIPAAAPAKEQPLPPAKEIPEEKRLLEKESDIRPVAARMLAPKAARD